MDAEINNIIYMELNSGPKIANSTCGKTIDVETIDRDSTVLVRTCIVCHDIFQHWSINESIWNGWPTLNGQISAVFYIQVSVHHEIYASNCLTRCNYIQFIYICKLLHMFQVVSPPIIRSSCHCVHSIWH